MQTQTCSSGAIKEVSAARILLGISLVGLGLAQAYPKWLGGWWSFVLSNIVFFAQTVWPFWRAGKIAALRPLAKMSIFPTAKEWAAGVRLVLPWVLPTFCAFSGYCWISSSCTLGYRFENGLSDVSRFAYFMFDQIFGIALVEEIFYRGYVQTVWQQAFPAYSAFYVDVQVNIWFALAHMVGTWNWSRLLTVFPGMLFSYAFRREGIWVAVLVHAFCNGLSFGFSEHWCNWGHE
jgi:membrane protease YdiL (CAAX protease family)